MNEQEKVRLNKYLADCGVCSRREADQLISEGRVTVNQKPAPMGYRVSPQDEVMLNGKAVKSKNTTVILAFNKPTGVTCTSKDKYAEKTIIDYIKYPVRVTYAGRLDKDSEGLILLSNDGELINRLMRAANYHEKEYAVKVNKEITDSFLKGMRNGVYLKELEETTRPCVVEQQGKFTFRIILTQGLNRQIRRMCKEFGYEVTSLRRIRVMNILLGQLPVGQYRELTDEEKKTLYESVGMGQ